MSKHTQGNWSVVEDVRFDNFQGEDYIAGFDIVSDDGEEILGCEGISGGGDEERANATLMAAAPDLLHALESLIGLLYSRGIPDPYPGEPEIQTICRAAIAKAKGESA